MRFSEKVHHRARAFQAGCAPWTEGQRFSELSMSQKLYYGFCHIPAFFSEAGTALRKKKPATASKSTLNEPLLWPAHDEGEYETFGLPLSPVAENGPPTVTWSTNRRMTEQSMVSSGSSRTESDVLAESLLNASTWEEMNRVLARHPRLTAT